MSSFTSCLWLDGCYKIAQQPQWLGRNHYSNHTYSRPDLENCKGLELEVKLLF